MTDPYKFEKKEPTFIFDNDFGDIPDNSSKQSASDTQVGGDHYTNLAIQPMYYSMVNELNALQHTTIKYVTRYQDKGTPLQDLAKARHCIDMLIEFELEGNK
tara:strand:+ start:3016 stop:3321 length:306 start_codon:yes stop_codon:yes gene_type:complete